MFVEYSIYDDQPEMNRDGDYVGILLAYGYAMHIEGVPGEYCTVLPSECIWIVPGTIEA